MTTVAYKDGVLVGDTRITEGETILPERARKVFRLADGSLFGFCGCVENAKLVRNAVERGLPLPKLEARQKEDAFIHVRRNGKVFYSTGVAWVQIEGTRIVSIGSGSLAAYAAMRAGRSAVDAVRIASTLDPYTNDRLKTVRLKQRSVKPKVARSRR